MELQKYEVVKMVNLNAISAAYTTKRGNGFVIAFASTSTSEAKDVVIKLVTQKGNEKTFATLTSVHTFMNDVGIKSFTVAG